VHIRVVAPGAAVDREGVTLAAALVRARGHEVTLGGHVFDHWRYLPGPLEARCKDLEEAFRDRAVVAVWCARGGTGAGELLPRLGDWFASKPIVGYSDNCGLLVEAHRRGAAAIHGTVFEEAALRPGGTLRLDAIDALELLERPAAARPAQRFAVERVAAGVAAGLSGHAVGGNLTTLCSMLGTPHAPCFDDGVLLLEDVGEAYYRIERMLVQLMHSGVLDRVRAVVLGDFVDCPRRNVVHSIDDIFLEHLGPRGIALYTGAPIGHGNRNMPWRLGARVEIVGGSLTLS
jgi:muramoyltetrapeptide carboxypeptidase